jgi:hypothetical protein
MIVCQPFDLDVLFVPDETQYLFMALHGSAYGRRDDSSPRCVSPTVAAPGSSRRHFDRRGDAPFFYSAANRGGRWARTALALPRARRQGRSFDLTIEGACLASKRPNQQGHNIKIAKKPTIMYILIYNLY